MLRSIFIGFAIAALLQVGLYSAASTRNLVLTPNVKAMSLDCDSTTLLRLLGAGLGFAAR